MSIAGFLSKKLMLNLVVLFCTAFVTLALVTEGGWYINRMGRSFTLALGSARIRLQGTYQASMYDEGGSVLLRYDPKPDLFSRPPAVFISLGYSYRHRLKEDTVRPVYAITEENGLPYIMIFLKNRSLVIRFKGNRKSARALVAVLCEQLSVNNIQKIPRSQIDKYITTQRN